MKATDDLFHLIKSMSGPEKGYFKKHSSTHVLHGENIYIKLFDAIDEQQEYDENKIVQHFKKETFVKHLTVIKNYLFKQITQSLVAYYEENKIRIKIRELISVAEILYEKNLVKSFTKTLDKAKKLATEYGENQLLLQILTLEKQLLYLYGDIKAIKKKTVASQLGEIDTLESIKHDTAIKNISIEMSFLIREIGFPNSETEKKKYKHLVDELKKQQNKKSKNWQNNATYYSVLLSYYVVGAREYAKAYDASQNQIAVYESNKNITNNNLSLYIQALNNHLLVCEMLGKENERTKTLDKLKNLSLNYPAAKNEFIAATIFETILASEFLYIRKRMAYEKAPAILEYFEANQKKYAKRLKKYRLLLRYFTVSTIYLHMGQHNKCNVWLNKILKEDETYFGVWLSSAVRSLQLIVHYEMGNYELVNYLQKSGYRFHQKKDKLYQFQQLFFNFFSNKILNAKTPEETIKHFTWLKEKLIAIKNNPQQNVPFEFFDYLSWAESKIEKKPFMEILKRKAKNLN